MDTLQCAVILAKLESFDWEIEQRIRIGRSFRDQVAEISRVKPPTIRNDRTCVWAQFTVQVEDRDKVGELLKRLGIPTAVHYPVPLHHQPAYRSICRQGSKLSAAESVSKQVISLPMHPYMSDDAVRTVAQALQRSMEAR